MAIDLSVYDEAVDETAPPEAQPPAPDLTGYDEAVAEEAPRQEAAPVTEVAAAPAEPATSKAQQTGPDLSGYDAVTQAPEVPLHQHPFVVNTLSDPHLSEDQQQELITTYGQSYQNAYGADTGVVDSFKMNFGNAWDNYNTLGAQIRKDKLDNVTPVERLDPAASPSLRGKDALSNRIDAIHSELKRREAFKLDSARPVKMGKLERIGKALKATFTGDTALGREAFQADKTGGALSAEAELLRAELSELQESRYSALMDEARKQGEFTALDSEGLIENAAAFAGSLGGAAVDPINLVPVAKPVQGAGLGTRMLAKGAQFAAINAAVNPALQDAAQEANQQEGFEWGQFAADTGLGFLAGAGFEGLGDAAKTVLARFKVDAAKIEGKPLNEAIGTIAKESGESAEDVAKVIELEVSKPELKETIDQLRKATTNEDGTKQRGFSERLKGDENFDAAEIAANPKEYYDPQVNARGEEVVAAMDDAQLGDTFNNMNPDAPSGQNWSTLAGIEKLRRAVAAGKDTKAIREELSKRGTTLGQAIQQYSQWKTATPEGLLAVVEDAAGAKGRKLQQVSKDRGMDLAKRRLQAQEKLRQAEAKHLDEFTDETAAAYKAARQDAAESAREFDKFTRDMMPPEFWRTMSTTLKGNLLTSESLLINVLGNALYYPVRKAKGVIATGMDALWSMASGTRTHAEGAAKTRGEIVGAKEGLVRGLQALRFGGTMDDYIKAEVQHGFRPVRALMQAFAPGEKGLMPVKESTGKVAMSDRARKLVEGLVGAPPETMFRLLQLGDQPFRGSAYKGAVEELATLKKLTGKERQKFITHPDAASRALAEERGNAAVFMKDGAVGKVLKQVDNMVGKIPVIGKPSQFLGTLIMPYRQFPINFVMEAADYALPALSIGKSLYHASRGNQREATELMAKAVTGLTLYSTAALLYEKGVITPSVDYRDRKLKQLSYNFEQPPGTLNVTGLKRLMKGEDPAYKEGDKVMNYEKTGIAGIAMHLESQSRWQRQKAFAEGNPAIPDPSWWDRALPIKDLPNTASYMAEATPLLGMSSAMGALLDWERRGESFLRDMGNAVSSIAVPNSVTAGMKTQYEHIPELEGKTTAETFRNIWNYKTHQLDGNHPSKVGLLGEKIERTPSGVNPWTYHLVNPIDLRSPEKKRTYQFIEKLYRKTGDTGVIPGHPTERFTDPRTSESYKLDPENLALLQEHVGKGRQFAIKESGLTMDQVNELTNEEIVYFMKKLYRIGREIGVTNFIEDERVDLSKADTMVEARGFTDE